VVGSGVAVVLLLAISSSSVLTCLAQLRTVPARSFAEQCVESHTWPPALSYPTPPCDTKLQATRPREAGTGRRRRVPRLPADRDPHPAEPLHTGRLAADAARVVGG
jgi:hypothetical protein